MVYYDVEQVVKSVRYAADSFGVARLYGDYSSYDDVAFDDAKAVAEIDAAVIADCESIAAKGHD